MRGASALQKVLDEHRDVPLRVFVVWEPVLKTDLGPPSTKKLAIVHDARAAQFWDPKRSLAGEILQAYLTHPDRYPPFPQSEPVTDETIVWDVLLLFPPGATWSDGLAVPSLAGAPVFMAVDQLGAALDPDL